MAFSWRETLCRLYTLTQIWLFSVRSIHINSSSVLYSTFHFYFITVLSRYSKTFFPSICVCAHTHAPLYIFLLFDTWKFSIHGFSWWWPYKSFESQLVFLNIWNAHGRKPSHFWKKAATNTELYWKRSQILMENINVIKNSLAFILRIFLYLIATCDCISFFFM